MSYFSILSMLIVVGAMVVTQNAFGAPTDPEPEPEAKGRCAKCEAKKKGDVSHVGDHPGDIAPIGGAPVSPGAGGAGAVGSGGAVGGAGAAGSGDAAGDSAGSKPKCHKPSCHAEPGKPSTQPDISVGSGGVHVGPGGASGGSSGAGDAAGGSDGSAGDSAGSKPKCHKPSCHDKPGKPSTQPDIGIGSGGSAPDATIKDIGFQPLAKDKFNEDLTDLLGLDAGAIGAPKPIPHGGPRGCEKKPCHSSSHMTMGMPFSASVPPQAEYEQEFRQLYQCIQQTCASCIQHMGKRGIPYDIGGPSKEVSGIDTNGLVPRKAKPEEKE